LILLINIVQTALYDKLLFPYLLNKE